MKTYCYEGREQTIEYFVDMLKSYKIEAQKKHTRLFKTLDLIEFFPGARVLDIGCNTGYISFILYERGFDVTGIDIYEYQIAIANDLKKHLKIDTDKIKFVQMDLLKKELPENYFDYALFTEVIEHVENPWGFLIELNRVLRPGGYLIVSTPNVVNFYYILKQLYPNYKKLFNLINDEPRGTGTHKDHIFSWDIFTFYRLLNRAGFKYVTHRFATLEIIPSVRISFDIPVLSRFSRTMIFKVQKQL